MKQLYNILTYCLLQVVVCSCSYKIIELRPINNKFGYVILQQDSVDIYFDKKQLLDTAVVIAPDYSERNVIKIEYFFNHKLAVKKLLDKIDTENIKIIGGNWMPIIKDSLDNESFIKLKTYYYICVERCGMSLLSNGYVRIYDERTNKFVKKIFLHYNNGPFAITEDFLINRRENKPFYINYITEKDGILSRKNWWERLFYR